MVSWFFSDQLGNNRRAKHRPFFIFQSLRRFPSITRHFCRFWGTDCLWSISNSPPLADFLRTWSCRTGGSDIRWSVHEGTRACHYGHHTIERNGRSDSFVLSSASLAGRPGRRVTWTSRVTTRLDPAGNTSCRLSAIFHNSWCN